MRPARLLWLIDRPIALVQLALIRLYQLTVSPMLGDVCRYYPSCSRYTYGAIQTHGALKGTLLGAVRILRCNPWAAGGIDHVPEFGAWRGSQNIANPTRVLRSNAQEDLGNQAQPDIDKVVESSTTGRQESE